MHIWNFQQQLACFPVFSLRDIVKIFPHFQRIQLDRWVKRGYICRLKQGFYLLQGQELHEAFLFLVANKIYAPSYISLEQALKFYGFIPEEVFQLTSVSTKKTTSFRTAVGNFSYRHLHPRLFWGYQLRQFGKLKFLLAEPEKALLDYLYLRAELRTAADFLAMRFNVEAWRANSDAKKLMTYLAAFTNKSLTQRVQVFLNVLPHA